MQGEYLSLKTENREYAIEPLFFDMLHVAVYDLYGNLVEEKQKMDSRQGWAWKTRIEQETGKRFVITKV